MFKYHVHVHFTGLQLRTTIPVSDDTAEYALDRLSEVLGSSRMDLPAYKEEVNSSRDPTYVVDYESTAQRYFGAPPYSKQELITASILKALEERVPELSSLHDEQLLMVIGCEVASIVSQHLRT